MTRLLAVAGTLTLLPAVVHASVVISEIAWMGTEAAATDEWIELHNYGEEAVDLSGWYLTDSKDLTIDLAGTIGAGEFVVLERTDDSTAPGEAWLIYTGALRNSGATLVLIDASGEVVDEVIGGANWHALGGNNATKATPQRTAAGWRTAAPTPGSPAPETSGVAAAAAQAFSFASSRPTAASEEKRASTTLLPEKNTGTPPEESGVAYLGLIGVLALGVAGAYLGKASNE